MKIRTQLRILAVLAWLFPATIVTLQVDANTSTLALFVGLVFLFTLSGLFSVTSYTLWKFSKLPWVVSNEELWDKTTDSRDQ